jgi:hypothetical protein
VRDLYPSTSKYAQHGILDRCGSAPLPEPTSALPGTREKVEVLRQRAQLRQSLFHPRDAKDRWGELSVREAMVKIGHNHRGMARRAS